MSQKKCSKCQTKKPISEFSKNKSKTDGLNSECKECVRAYLREYRKKKKNILKHNERNKVWRDNNSDHIKEYRKQYRKDNIEHIRKKDREYKQDNKVISIIRNRLSAVVKRLSLDKQYSTMEYLGCDQRTLLEWLQWSGERYDYDFDIMNYDTSLYHIDHIKTFEDVKKGIYTLEEVAHYTNLQILRAEENLRKGGTSW